MKRVLVISPSTDFSGVGINLKRAFDTVPNHWRARHVVGRPSPYGYPTDVLWPRRSHDANVVVGQLAAAADVLHIMDHPAILERLGHARQAIVVQHLGTRYREDPAGISNLCRDYGATEITDSFDLMVFPWVRWVPVAVDIAYLRAERERVYRPDPKVIRIAHAPTMRSTGSTDLVLATIERLRSEFAIEFDLIEHVSNAECIARKARADIYVDRIGIGFGVNAIEAWAMGIPVVSGMAPESAKDRAFAEFGHLPWLDVTEETLYEGIRSLIVDRDLWRLYHERGLAHAVRYHSFGAVVERTTEVYARAMSARVAA
jgi:hypothetical protein